MKIYPINTGYFKLDGGAMFGVVPKSIWQKTNPADNNNMCDWALRSLLIEDGERLMLIDTGMGTKQSDKFFGYYYLPMNTKSDISINYEKSKTRTNLKRQTHYRFCICQLLGLRRIYLFPPNSRDNLYYDKQSDSFDINFWEQNTDKYPLVKEAKYIEILLYPGQAIFIPNGWVFCYEMEENGMSVSFYSESIFSNMFKI